MPKSATGAHIRPLWLILLLFTAAVVLGLAGLMIYRQARVISEREQQISGLEKRNRQLETRLDQALRAAAPQPVPSGAPTPARTTTGQRSSATDLENMVAGEREIQRLRESLSQLHAEVARLQAQTSDLEAQNGKLTADNQRLAGAAEDLKVSLADANRIVQSLRVEIQRDQDRISQLVSENSRLLQDNSAGKQSAGDLRQVTTDLEEIFRRRQMYLNNILRRYKEITEQYRSLSGVLDSRRDREAVPASSAEISRIQNAIAMAEEDLKQISTLNTQAQRLEKKLPAK
jgi:chromosome segregation ATPase